MLAFTNNCGKFKELEFLKYNVMKRTLKRPLRHPKRSLENFAMVITKIDEIRLQPKPYLNNLMMTNQRLLNSNNVNNLLLF